MGIIKTPTKLNDERIREMIEENERTIKRVYSNKSSDEYKMHGDIRKSPSYDKIEKLIADLKTLKKFPSSEANDIKQMFNTLHRPIWAKMVTEYMAKPTERNTVYTYYFSTGYRLLVGELARIYASTEATEKGVVYHFDKVARKEMIFRFIRYYNDKIDEMVERAIADNMRVKNSVQESAVEIAEGVVNATAAILSLIGNIFRHAAEMNPVSFISALLSRSYDRKVEKFDEICDLYNATVQSYEDYMKLPESKRSERIESNYIKNMEKYNIKMNNLKAKIDHYDQRSIDETESSSPSKESKDDKSTSSKKETSSSNDEYDF